MKNANNSKKKVNRYFFLFTLFYYGCATLVVEIIAARILSPYFGNTIYSYSGIITIVLLGLSIGYFISGTLSDKYASFKWYFGTFFLSAVSVFLIHLLSTYILPLIGYKLSFTYGPVIISSLLFFLPALIFGMLSPMSLVLVKKNYIKHGLAKPASIVFFLSTIGSITGSLLTGFILVPFFGIDSILSLLSISLFIIAIIGYLPLIDNKARILIILLFLLFLVCNSYIKTPHSYHLFKADGLYELITIYDDVFQGRPVRVLKQDRSTSGVIYSDTGEIVPNSLKYYHLYKVSKKDIKRVLVIGGGAYLIPRDFTKNNPELIIDVVEIEPALFELSKKYFYVNEYSNINNYIIDGRRFLKSSTNLYDLIISDAYQSYFSIPIQYTTKQFFSLVSDRLTNDGVFIINVVDQLEHHEDSFVFSEIKTFKTIFPNSYFFATATPENKSIQNIIFMGVNSNKKIDFNNLIITDDTINNLSIQSKLIDLNQYDFNKNIILTDNYSPVEYFIGKTLKNSGINVPKYVYGPLSLP